MYILYLIPTQFKNMYVISLLVVFSICGITQLLTKYCLKILFTSIEDKWRSTLSSLAEMSFGWKTTTIWSWVHFILHQINVRYFGNLMVFAIFLWKKLSPHMANTLLAVMIYNLIWNSSPNTKLSALNLNDKLWFPAWTMWSHYNKKTWDQN